MWDILGGYWFASRSAHQHNEFSTYGLFYLNGAVVDAYGLYTSLNEQESFNTALRPCIEIDLTKTNIGETGTGEATSPYSIAKR